MDVLRVLNVILMDSLMVYSKYGTLMESFKSLDSTKTERELVNGWNGGIDLCMRYLYVDGEIDDFDTPDGVGKLVYINGLRN